MVDKDNKRMVDGDKTKEEEEERTSQTQTPQQYTHHNTPGSQGHDITNTHTTTIHTPPHTWITRT